MLVSLLFGLVSQSSDAISQDARLAAKVTIEVPITTLRELAKRIGTDAGVELKVDDYIGSRKATLFVRERSARETMEALADTFFLTWIPNGKGYRLTLAKGVADEEAEAVRLDRERMKAKIDDTFAGWRELDTMPPEDQAQEQARLSKELKTLTEATDQASKDRKAAIERWLALSSSGGWTSFAVAYDGRQSDVDDALMAGRTLFASTRPQDDCPRLGASFMKYNGGEILRGFDSAIAVMRIDFAGARLQGQFAFLGAHAGGGAPCGIRLLKEDDSAFSISKRFAAWSTVSDQSVSDLPLAPPPSRFPRLITLADQLSFLHRRTDAPIVADAYRVPCMVGRQPGETVGDFAERLRDFSALRFAKGAVALRTSAGWLEARHIRYWRLEPREMSEEIVQPFEDLAAHGKQLDLESLGALSAGLTDIQIAGLQDFQCPTFVAFPTSQLGAFRSLRLWNVLTEAQRSRARSSDGLGFDGLGGGQVALAKAALLNMFWGGGVTEKLLSLALGEPRAFAGSSLFFEEAEAQVQPDFTEFELMNDPSVLTGRVPGTAVNFLYGPNSGEALRDGFTSAKR